MEINKQSSVADIILFLKNNKLDEIVEDFKGIVSSWNVGRMCEGCCLVHKSSVENNSKLDL